MTLTGVIKEIPPPSPTCQKIFLHTCGSAGCPLVQKTLTLSPGDRRGHGLLSGLGAARWLEVNGEIWEEHKRATEERKWLLNGRRVQVNTLMFWPHTSGHVNSTGPLSRLFGRRWTVSAGQLVSSSQSDESSLYLLSELLRVLCLIKYKIIRLIFFLHKE